MLPVVGASLEKEMVWRVGSEGKSLDGTAAGQMLARQYCLHWGIRHALLVCVHVTSQYAVGCVSVRIKGALLQQ